MKYPNQAQVDTFNHCLKVGEFTRDEIVKITILDHDVRVYLKDTPKESNRIIAIHDRGTYQSFSNFILGE